MDETLKTQAPQWLLSRDGKKYGPMNSVQLKQLCKTGKISPADLICRVGSDRWTPAGEVRGLFSPPAQATAAALEETIRPIEEATASASHSADAYWKTIGSLFCIANLAVCGLVGLTKRPPEMVQAMNDMKKSLSRVHEDLKGVDEELQKIKPRKVIEDAIQNGDMPKIPDIPRMPGVR
jgi:hypothetical protein